MNIMDAVNEFYFNMTINELRGINANHDGKSLNYTTVMYLGLISYMENCTVSALAKALDVSKPAITSKVNELVAQGLVTRTQSLHDKRVYYLRIVQAVEKNFNDCDRPLDDAIARVQRDYAPEKVENFCEILQVFSNAFRKDQPHHGTQQDF